MSRWTAVRDWFGPVILGLGGGVCIAALAQYWGANPGYADRFLILLGAAYATWQLRPQFLAQVPTARPIFGMLPILLGGTAFALGTFLLQQIGARTLLLWWLTLAWLLAVSGWLLATQGMARLRVLAFPIAFWLFALPIPLRILNPSQEFLQFLTTGMAYEAFRLFGAEVTQQGYVLSLPGGKLGVEEACSGVRSLTALTALAAIIAFWNRLGLIRGLALVIGSIHIVVLVNFLRVLLSGYIQEWFGAAYIIGHWHEALGFAMVFLGLGLILLLSQWLVPSDRAQEVEAAVVEHPMPGNWLVNAGLLAIGWATIFMASLGSRQLQQISEKVPLSEISTELGSWRGTDQPIPDVVQDLLAPDVALHRRYRNKLGQEAIVWLFAWNTGASIRGYHHPDVCWGNKGFTPLEKWSQPIRTDAENWAVVGREFQLNSTKQTIFYWTQEGGLIWTEADEQAAIDDMLYVAGSGHRWVLELLAGRNDQRGPRLTGVIVLPGGGPNVRRDAIDLTQRVGHELHQIANWTKPDNR